MHFCPNCNNIFNITKDINQVEEQPIIQDVEKSNIYFYCDNCGFSKPVNPKTLLFSRTSKNISQSYISNDVVNMVHSDILFRTRRYICTNKDCESHENPLKREAIFFRLNNSYKVKYICTTCHTIIEN